MGDVVTSSIISNGMKPYLSIIDRKTRRNDVSPKIPGVLLEQCNVQKVANPSGKISMDAVDILCRLLEEFNASKCHVVIVDGEEDMLALPALSCAPEGSVVVYGVPEVGIAVFYVDNSIRYLASNRLLYLKPVECM
ncbi:MAG: GTP-dependent dephospho-CoA kinase family protein [Desulfurococcales archaeon]|nr:GTP-dependent dephospho-CoA kinase family protein [Desulfurococcales archaeon]